MGAENNITQLLAAWSAGSRDALDGLMPIVMPELRRIAAAYLSRESHARTLQTTALVNEAYLRLVQIHSSSWETRTQFFALAARIMRRILVDHARAQLGAKRSGRRHHVPLDEAVVANAIDISSVTDLDAALMALERVDQRKGRVVELRLFAGLSNAEVADALGISERTVVREWQFSKAWLARELNFSPPDGVRGSAS